MSNQESALLLKELQKRIYRRMLWLKWSRLVSAFLAGVGVASWFWGRE